MVEKYIETLPFTASVFVVALTIVAVLVAVFLLFMRLGGGVMSGQPIIFDFTVSIGGMTAPIARVTLDGAGEQGSSLLSLQLAEDIPDFVRSMSSAAADQIGKVLLMDAKTDAGFLPSIELADYLPKGVTIDANPKAKA